MPDAGKHIAVIGGGWAGLSCAVELSLTGHQVTLLESAKQLGGRARRVPFGDQAVDNGQHVLIGAYRHTLALFKRLNLPIDELLHRGTLNLHLQTCGKKEFNVKAINFVAPLNLLAALLTSKGFTLRDKWHALQFGLRLFTYSLSVDDDISVADLLKQQRQTRNNITALWEPICLASLNTPIEEASARIFIRVLYDTFCRSSRDSDLIVPKTDLGALLPDPAADFIELHGGNVHLGQRVTELVIDKRRIVAIKTEDRTLPVDQTVLALPPHACAPLIKPHPALHEIAYNLSAFTYNPIVTVYLRYKNTIRPDRPIQAMLNTMSQWVIDRSISGQAGLLAVVISGPGKHMELDNDILADEIQKELHACFPHWPRAEEVMIIREKRATFSSRVNIDSLRPPNKTPIHGLWLCGDYTATGYPGTIESAVISGKTTAELVHRAVIENQDAA
jgi:squalene-associated FAD-dependent desaturase